MKPTQFYHLTNPAPINSYVNPGWPTTYLVLL